jgi:hypothetical protein
MKWLSLYLICVAITVAVFARRGRSARRDPRGTVDSPLWSAG